MEVAVSAAEVMEPMEQQSPQWDKLFAALAKAQA